MFARAASGTVIGIDAYPVIVESHRGKGLPGLAVVGLARGAVRESSVRVRSALTALGLSLCTQRLVVNLLPADLPKEASSLDLALAVSLLASGGVVPLESLEKRRFFGELSLGGRLEASRGAVLLADLARRSGDTELLVPADNAQEAAMIPGVRIIGVQHLQEVVDYLKGNVAIAPSVLVPPAVLPDTHCLSDISGQVHAKQALEIAAAGGHNMLMIGPPGSGKTMLARRLPGILPALSAEEAIEVTRIHSAAALMRNNFLMQERPFRAPHHTASEAAICGGGSLPRPGEITLAHRGVLFLDELPEFSRRALESLREPLEEGSIHIARAALSLCFPASVLLVAAMNPCPCGYYVDDATRMHNKKMTCVCSFEQIVRYRSRISGPLLDRIDLHVAVESVPYRDLWQQGSGEKSHIIKQRVAYARQIQRERLGGDRSNASMNQAEVRKYIALNATSMKYIEHAMLIHRLSARAVGRILKVARTIADLAGQSVVHDQHIEHATELRLLERSAITIADSAA